MGSVRVRAILISAEGNALFYWESVLEESARRRRAILQELWEEVRQTSV